MRSAVDKTIPKRKPSIFFWLSLILAGLFILIGPAIVMPVIRTFAPPLEPSHTFAISGDQEVDCHEGDCYAVNLSANVYHFDAETGSSRVIFSKKEGFTHLALSPDGRKLYVASPGIVGVLTSLEGTPVYRELHRYPQKWRGEAASLLAVDDSEQGLLFGANTARFYLGSASNPISDDHAPGMTVRHLLRAPDGVAYGLLQGDTDSVIARVEPDPHPRWVEIYRAKGISAFNWSTGGVTLAIGGEIYEGRGLGDLKKVGIPKMMLVLSKDSKAAALSQKGRLAASLADGLSIRETSGRWAIRRHNSHPRSLHWIGERTLVVVDDMGFIEVFRV